MMDNIEPQSLLIAATVGGAILLGAIKYFTSSSTATSKGKSKKKRSKSNKKKANEEIPQVPIIHEKKDTPAAHVAKVDAVLPPTKKVDASVKFAEVLKQPKVESVNISEEADSEAKKKKKRSKKKKPTSSTSANVIEESDDAREEEEELEVFGAAAKEARKENLLISRKVEEVKAVNGAKVAADFVTVASQEEEVLEGWETVPVKQRKMVEVSVMDVYTDTPAGNKKSQKKKEKKESMKILPEHVSVVLGENGSTINNIQAMSGANVKIKRDQGICEVMGDDEAIQVAKQLIISLISNQAKHEIILTSRLDRAILSKAGTNQQIRDISGAKVDYDFGKEKDDPMKVIITGEKDAVEVAKGVIEDYLKGKTPEGGDGIKRMKISGFQGRILIGQKGSQINKLQKETGATINIEFEDDASNSENKKAFVTVIGTSGQVEAGIEAVRSFLSKHNFSVPVPLDPAAKGIIGKLNNLRTEIPNLNVDLNEEKTDILLTGSEEGVNEGREILKKWIERELGPPELKPGEAMKEIDLGAAAGKVIGKNKSVLNNLLQKFPGAKVELKQDTTCYVYGQPSAVTKLAEEIEDIISKHEDIVAKTKQEQDDLRAASWVIQDVVTGTSAKVAAENDWGCFQLAQAQKW